MTTTSSKLVLTELIAFIVLVLVFPFTCFYTQAQTVTTFIPEDKFAVPELNGAISFAVDGSYSAATLDNGTWTFKDLRLNSSESIGDLKVSAENSNVTVTFFRPYNSSFRRSASVIYMVEGRGKQTINLGLNSSQPSSAIEWSVIVPNNVFLAEGEGWNLLPDNTVVITGATGNVRVVHYSFSVPDEGNLPVYVQHSIAIITVTMLGITVTIAIIIRFKMRK